MDLDSISQALAGSEWSDRLSAFKPQFMLHDDRIYYISGESNQLLLLPAYDDLRQVAKE